MAWRDTSKAMLLHKLSYCLVLKLRAGSVGRDSSADHRSWRYPNPVIRLQYSADMIEGSCCQGCKVSWCPQGRPSRGWPAAIRPAPRRSVQREGRAQGRTTTTAAAGGRSTAGSATVSPSGASVPPLLNAIPHDREVRVRREALCPRWGRPMRHRWVGGGGQRTGLAVRCCPCGSCWAAPGSSWPHSMSGLWLSDLGSGFLAAQ